MKFNFIKYAIFALALTGIFFAGCGDDTDKKLDPTITLDASSTADNSTLTLKDGKAAQFRIKFSANKGADGKNLKTFGIKVSYNGRAATPLVPDSTLDLAVLNFDRTFSTSLDEGKEVYTITVADKDGKTATRTLTYTVKKETLTVEPKKPISRMGISLSNSNGNLDSKSGTVYTDVAGEAQAANIDITYMNTKVGGDNLISPHARKLGLYDTVAIGNQNLDKRLPWGTVNTEFKTTSLSATDFNRVKDEDESKLAEIFNNGNNIDLGFGNPLNSRISFSAKYFETGKVVAYRRNGKFGLILINNAAGLDKPNGSANISILLQN